MVDQADGLSRVAWLNLVGLSLGSLDVFGEGPAIRRGRPFWYQAILLPIKSLRQGQGFRVGVGRWCVDLRDPLEWLFSVSSIAKSHV